MTNHTIPCPDGFDAVEDSLTRSRMIIDALRSEVARLQAENQKMHHDWMHEHAEHEALKAKLARYEGDLTGPQQVGVLNEISTVQIGTFTLRLIDAAIRKGRGEP